MVAGSRPAVPAGPPLWVWRATGAGAVLLLGLLTVLAFWSERRMSRRFATDAGTMLRREWTARSDSVTRVVVLGTSLVEYGVADPEYFARRCGRRVRVVKLFRESTGIEGFMGASPIFQLLERYPPDVLCIEENLLLFRLPYSMKPELNKRLASVLNQHLAVQVAALKVQLGWWAADRSKAALFEGFPPGQRQLNSRDTLDALSTLTEIRSRTVRTPRESPAIDASLHRLRQHGTRLVLLHLPRPAVLETVIHGEGRAPLLQNLIAHYQRDYQADYWHFDRPMPFRCFADYAHLNHLGNAVYSDWLASRIAPPRSAR